MSDTKCPRCHLGIDDDGDGNCIVCFRLSDAEVARMSAPAVEAPAPLQRTQDTASPEFEQAKRIADKYLDIPYIDPDGDVCVLSRQFLRLVERLSPETQPTPRRGDPTVGRTVDEERRPLICFVCAGRFAVTFNFCLEHKDEYERLKAQSQSEFERGRLAGREEAATYDENEQRRRFEAKRNSIDDFKMCGPVHRTAKGYLGGIDNLCWTFWKAAIRCNERSERSLAPQPQKETTK